MLGNPGETATITLRLPGRGASLSGIVRGPEGAVVVGALVLVGNEHPQSATLPSGERGFTPPPRYLVTDDAGRFAVEGLAPQSTGVMVRTDSHAPWKGGTMLEEGLSRELLIDLKLGASLAGVVTQEDDSPVSDVSIRVGGYGAFLSSQTNTKSDGSFRLTGLEPGAIEVSASSGDHGKTKATLHAMPGEEVRWDPRLVSGGVVGGLVTDEGSTPLVGWKVTAIKPGRPGLFLRSTRTGDDGRFTITNCPLEDFHLEIREPDVWSASAPVTLTDFEVGDEGMVIVVPVASLASCFVDGRLIDAAGGPIAGVPLYAFLQPQGSSVDWFPEAETGSFSIGPLAPGAYSIQVRTPYGVFMELKLAELAANERLDLGTIVIDDPGGFRVSVFLPEGVDGRGVSAFLRRSPTRLTRIELVDGVGFDDKLIPGSYTLRLSGQVVATAEQEVTIHAGETTEVVATLQPATQRGLQVHLPTGAVPAGTTVRVYIEVKDDNGVSVMESWRQSDGDPVFFSAGGLVRGTYTVEAHTDEGLVGEASLRVEDLEPSRELTIVELR